LLDFTAFRGQQLCLQFFWSFAEEEQVAYNFICFSNLFIQCCVTFLESHGAASKKKCYHWTWNSLLHAPTSSWCKVSPTKQDHSQKLETWWIIFSSMKTWGWRLETLALQQS
jgi:hypothetical protein